MGNCWFSSDDTSCGSAIGNCKNSHCASSCSKKTQETAIQLEEAIDAIMKNWIETHLHHYLREHLSSPIAHQIEDTLIEAINIDLVPRLSVVKETASENQEALKSPTV